MAHERKKYSRYKSNKKMKETGIIIAIIAFTLFAIMVGYFLISLYMPNTRMESAYQFVEGLTENQINILFNDQLLTSIENKPIEQDGDFYLPVDFVREHLDPYIFWDEPVNMLTITTQDKVIRMRSENLDYYVNNQPMSLHLPVYNMEGVAYMPVDLLMELYHVDIHFQEAYQILIVDSTDIERVETTLIKETAMRYEPHRKSPIAEKLEEGEKVMLFPADPDMPNYRSVRTARGLIGYVEVKYLGEEHILEPVTQEIIDNRPDLNIDGPIVLLWDQVFNVEASANPSRRQVIPGVNVLSPTWFSFDEEKLNGDIINIAHKAYVEWAHKNGYQVWALISDNFNGKVNNAILSNSEVREHVIKQLLAFIALYELDGINIDFENVAPENAANFIQFLRELKPLMHEQGAILSVDLFVPLYTRYYNRTEIAKTVDYVCVMTYDEHWSGSPQSGPVASLGFVEQGIIDTLEEVPKEQVLMGLPFYVRVWREELDSEGNISRSIRNFAMDTVYQRFRERGVQFEWLEDIGSYYGEYTVTENGKPVTYRVWHENARSIEAKMELFKAYDLAGVACWKKGLESADVWDVIQQFL